MEGSCSTGQSPQWAVVPVEEEVDTETPDFPTPKSHGSLYHLLGHANESVQLQGPLYHFVSWWLF
jgi:hypothetical protein